MGRGDKRSKKGKINIGSHGKSRPKTKNVLKNVVAKAEVAEKIAAKAEASTAEA